MFRLAFFCGMPGKPGAPGGGGGPRGARQSIYQLHYFIRISWDKNTMDITIVSLTWYHGNKQTK